MLQASLLPPPHCPGLPLYRQVDLRPGELLYRVLIPFTRPYEYVKEFKQSPRREDDIAIVNAGMQVRLEPSGDDWLVAEASLAFGGVAAKAVMAPKAAAALLGKLWNQATLDAALAALGQDIVISDSAPGGKVEYRRALTASFLFKFFIGTSLALENDTAAANAAKFSPDFPAQYRSAGQVFDRHPAKGVQFYAEASPADVVGQPVRHMAADLQVRKIASGQPQLLACPEPRCIPVKACHRVAWNPCAALQLSYWVQPD